MANIHTVDVLGTNISAVDLQRAVEEVTSWILSGDRQYICVTGVHGVMESYRQPNLRAIHNNAGLVLPDGRPMMWSGRFVGLKEIDQVRGADFMRALCKLAAENGWSSFFYGGADGVADRLALRFGEQFPDMPVAGTHTPPFRPLDASEMSEVADKINASGADIVWVGLSTPKQERWMAEMRPLLKAPVLAGVGGAFDMHSGGVPQAPTWVQTVGLEWLFRLLLEPRRMWRRYLRNNTSFVFRIIQNRPKSSKR